MYKGRECRSREKLFSGGAWDIREECKKPFPLFSEKRKSSDAISCRPPGEEERPEDVSKTNLGEEKRGACCEAGNLCKKKIPTT